MGCDDCAPEDSVTTRFGDWDESWALRPHEKIKNDAAVRSRPANRPALVRIMANREGGPITYGPPVTTVQQTRALFFCAHIDLSCQNITGLRLTADVTEQPEDDDENENGGYATTAQLPRRRARQEPSEWSLHSFPPCSKR